MTARTLTGTNPVAAAGFFGVPPPAGRPARDAAVVGVVAALAGPAAGRSLSHATTRDLLRYQAGEEPSLAGQAQTRRANEIEGGAVGAPGRLAGEEQAARLRCEAS
jgi:hypothetical protein